MATNLNKPTIIYGFHAIESMIINDAKNVTVVWLDKNRRDKRSQQIAELLKKHGIKHKLVPRNFLDKQTNNTKHQGIIAEYKGESSPKEISIEEILKKESVFLLILDGVKDPHNLGAILRSANAVGVDAVIVPKDKAVGLTPVVRKIASGAVENTPLIQVTNLTQVLNKLKIENVWCIGTDGEAKKEIYEADFTGRIAVIMGSEDKGLRRLTRENCDVLVKIPMKGIVESLNVSVATGVVLFEALRQRLKIKSS